MKVIQKIFSDDDFLILRRESYNFIRNFLFTCKQNTSLLEIGPSGIADKNTSYSQWDTSSYIKDFCNDNYIEYKSCDIINGCDYTCNIENLSSINRTFDYIIANSVIEHVQKIWLIPEQIKRVLQQKMLIVTPFMFKIHGPNPDCWRISPAGYQSLFDAFNLNFESYPPNQLYKNSIPLLIKVEVSK